uniref:DUF2834 domain-containing protein n=1 Tax=Trichocoleus desertorum TaxID=1481672 RepID=UPI0025B3ABCA|nr:DUF2834 domain-containing protein [Trichocoleus desertorum]
MLRKVGLWLLWIGFIAYAVFLAPPWQPDMGRLQNLLAGNWTDINAVVLAIFSLIGMWVAIYSCLMFADGRMQKLPAWPFILGSLGTGVLGLIPYLASREPNQHFSGTKDSWLKFWDSRRTAWLISLSTIAFVAYGTLLGDWAGFVQEFQTSRFIHMMSLACCLFGLLFPTLLGDDMARRGLKDARLFWTVALIPLFGPLAYLCFRPALPEA